MLCAFARSLTFDKGIVSISFFFIPPTHTLLLCLLLCVFEIFSLPVQRLFILQHENKSPEREKVPVPSLAEPAQLFHVYF